MRLVQVSRPHAIYNQLSRMIFAMDPGTRMPSYQTLIKQLGCTQRSLDITYEELSQVGAIRSAPRSGVFVRNPYAGATLLFGMPASALDEEGGCGARRQYLTTRNVLPRNFPGASLELLILDSNVPSERDHKIQAQLRRLMHGFRSIGLITSYHIEAPSTHRVLARLGLPLIDSDNPRTPHTVKTPGREGFWRLAINHLQAEGWKRIAVVKAVGETHPDGRLSPQEMRLRAEFPGVEHLRVPVLFGGDYEKAAAVFIQDLISSNHLPQAFVISDDYLCRGCLRGALERGVDLLSRCAMVAFVNEGSPISTTRQLTVVEYPHTVIAEQQMLVLRHLLRQKPISEMSPVTFRLIVGATSLRRDYNPPSNQ